MYDPNNFNPHDLNPDDVSDSDIKKLLASTHLPARQLGVALLDYKKRQKFCGVLRIWSNRYGWQLTGLDIAEIWEATMTSIQKNVDAGRFQEAGNLNAYVRRITDRRAADFLKKRIRIDYGVDVQMIEGWRFDDYHETSEPHFIKMIRACIDKLPDREQRVINHHFNLFFVMNGKWPASSQLITSVNEDGGDILSSQAIISARSRGLRKLRKVAMKKEE